MSSRKYKKHNHFIVDIIETQGHTWQGRIQWIDGKKDENFRSVLELIKLIDSAIEKNDLKKE